MKIDNLDGLFGTSEFEHLREKSEKSEVKAEAKPLDATSSPEGSKEKNDSVPMAVPEELTHRVTAPMGSGFAQERAVDHEEPTEDTAAYPDPAEAVKKFLSAPRSWLPKPMIVLGVALALASFVAISVVSLHVKMRKNALSYELSAQTKMMRRLEKRKAMFELEYSFLRSSQSIKAKVKELGWQEITPHTIKFIKPQEKKR